MTNGLAYEICKNFTNKTKLNSSKYIQCKMLAYLTGCIHATRQQLGRLYIRVQKLRGVARDSFLGEIFKFSQSRKPDSTIEPTVTEKCDARTQTELLP